MQSETPWYAYFAILAFYLVFEAVYLAFMHRFWATHMLEELLATIRTLKGEIESDNDGTQLCAYIVTIVLITSPVLILICSVAGMVKHDSAKDLVVGLVLLVFMIPVTLGLRLFNELCMSWIKRIRTKR
jgi:hypothetical protein